ncbi:MAG: divalent-cation tolerance protein CutA [Candidatus Eisenbacteria bacterium]
MTTPAIAVHTTLSSEQAAHDLAATLVTEKLAACAHVYPIESVYRWKGEVTRDKEWVVLLKTREALYERAAARIRDLHSYEVPEIIALPITHGLPEYVDWIDASTIPDGGKRR